MKTIRDWSNFRWVAESQGYRMCGVNEPEFLMSKDEVEHWCLRRAAYLAKKDNLLWDPFNLTLLFSRLSTT